MKAPQLTVMDDEARAVLAKAKGIVARGWCQGGYSDGSAVCINGAVCVALYGEVTHELVGQAERFSPALQALSDACGDYTFLWNDRPGRTQAEVVALFDTVLVAHPASVEALEPVA